MFISFEGGEGSGKTTQLQALKSQLNTLGLGVQTFREPGGASGAESIRELVLNGPVDRWHPVEELFLFSAARHELVRTAIAPALAAGDWVLCDRFADSSAVYQGRAGGVAAASLQAVEDLATQGIQPHKTILIDVPVEIGLARAERRISGMDAGQKEDRFEGKTTAFHNSVRQAFLDRAKQFPSRFIVIDGSEDADKVSEAIWQAVKPLIRP